MVARVFRLMRDVDQTGMSGTGRVAEGVEFDDGTTVMHWLVPPSSTGIYDTVDELVHIHGHNGATRLEYLDEVDDPDIGTQAPAVS